MQNPHILDRIILRHKIPKLVNHAEQSGNIRLRNTAQRCVGCKRSRLCSTTEYAALSDLFSAVLVISATCSERGNFDRTADQQCVRIFMHARSQIVSYFCRLTLLPLLFALHFPACAELQHCFSFFVTEPPRAFPIRSDQTCALPNLRSFRCFSLKHRCNIVYFLNHVA